MSVADSHTITSYQSIDQFTHKGSIIWRKKRQCGYTQQMALCEQRTKLNSLFGKWPQKKCLTNAFKCQKGQDCPSELLKTKISYEFFTKTLVWCDVLKMEIWDHCPFKGINQSNKFELYQREGSFWMNDDHSILIWTYEKSQKKGHFWIG